LVGWARIQPCPCPAFSGVELRSRYSAL